LIDIVAVSSLDVGASGHAVGLDIVLGPPDICILSTPPDNEDLVNGAVCYFVDLRSLRRKREQHKGAVRRSSMC
jgi:hypothetical protein